MIVKRRVNCTLHFWWKHRTVQPPQERNWKFTMDLITGLVCDLCVTCPDPLRSIGYYNNGTEIKDRREWREETSQVRTRASKKAFELWWRPDPQERECKLEGLIGKLLSRSKRSLLKDLKAPHIGILLLTHLDVLCICYSHWLGSMKEIRVAWILHKCRVGGITCYLCSPPHKAQLKAKSPVFSIRPMTNTIVHHMPCFRL